MPTDSSPVVELLTIAEVAQFLKISISSVRRLCDARQVPFIKVGGSVRFVQGDITTYIERQRVGAIG